MTLVTHENEPGPERRYDPETLEKVTALAARLQSAHRDTLTMADMESIGAEVGIEPQFIQQALSQIDASAQGSEALLGQGAGELSRVAVSTEKAELPHAMAPALAALTLPLLWGPFAYAFHSSPGLMTLFTLLTPGPLSALMGFVSGNRQVARVAALSLMLSLAPTFPYLFYRNLYPDQIDPGMFLTAGFFYLLLGIPAARALGRLGADLRSHLQPGTERGIQFTERPGANLGPALAEASHAAPRMVHRAFLSVEVVGWAEMRASESPANSAQAFQLFHRWVAEIARNCGASVESAAGEQRVFAFASDQSAIIAARRLQEGMSGFNQTLNRLPAPFRLRCGLSSCDAQTNPGAIGFHGHAPAVDRAITLQGRAASGEIVLSGELAASAEQLLGPLTPLPEQLFGPDAFCWRAA